MCPLVASPIADITPDVSNEEVFLHLMSIKGGSGLPNNVITDTNPCLYLPANLPVDIWYLIALQEKKATEHGIWKAKGGACELFSDSVITGWRNTLQFYEGPQERKTDWMMQEFWITHKGHSESSKKELLDGANSLCRIFLGGVRDSGHENFSITETLSGSTRLAPPHVSRAVTFANSSERKTEVEQSGETGKRETVRTNLNLPMVNSAGFGDFAGGDYLELFDLDTPLSPSSSSDSNCATMSSGEFFDSLELLRDLEGENTDQVQKDENCKLNISATNRADELFMLPVSPENEAAVVEEICGNQQLTPNKPDNTVLQQSVKNEGADNMVKGPLSSYQDKGAASSSRKGRKADKGRQKSIKSKCFCFIPF